MTLQSLDARGTIDQYLAAMKVREALLALLRAHCEMYGLPPPVLTRAERGLERGGRAEFAPPHHNRQGSADE